MEDIYEQKRAELREPWPYKSWREIGQDYPGISFATLRDFAYGANPGEKLCHALGLPPQKLAPCCPDCGNVPLSERCPTCHPAPTPRHRLRLIIDVTNQPELKDAVEELSQACGKSAAAWMRQALIYVVANQETPNEFIIES